MKRFIILFATVALVVSLSAVAFAVPPPGTSNNILNFKTSVEEYESGVMLIKGNFPLDDGQIRQYYINSNVRYNYQTYNRTWMQFNASYGDIKNGSYLVGEVFPFGYFTDKNQFNLNKCISLKGLPNGTNLVLDAQIGGIYSDFVPVDSYGPNTWRVYLSFYDKDGNALGDGNSAYTEYHYDEVNGPQAYVSIPIEAPAEAVAFRIYYRYQTRVSELTSNDWIFEDGIHSISFRYMINKAEYETALSGYENDQIIGSIDNIDQSINNGFQNMDDTLTDGFQGVEDTITDGYNRPLEPDQPSGSDKFDALDDLESGLVQDAESYLDSYYELMDSTGVSIQTLGNTFTAVKVFLESLLDIPALKTLVSVSLVLGLSGTILGIVGNVRVRKG